MPLPSLRHFFLMLFFIALFCGCATTRTPDAPRQGAIQDGRQATALLRVSARADGEIVDALKHLAICVANLDDGEPCNFGALPKSPSPDASKDGWLSFVVKPGDVYELRLGFGLAEPQSGPFFPSEIFGKVFWFRVPDNAPLVYAGSFRLSCEGKWNDRRTRYLLTSCTLSVEDESETASAAAREWFPVLQPMSTALLRPSNYSALARLSPEDLPLGLATATAKGIESPQWYRRSLSRTTGIGDWLSRRLNRSSQDSGTGLGQALKEGAGQALAPYVALAYVVYLPPATLFGAAGGAHSAVKWQPCVDRLSEALQTFELEKTLSTSLSEAIAERGIDQITQIPMGDNMFEEADQAGTKSILEARVRSVVLKECTTRWTWSLGWGFSLDWTFSLDVTFRARLWETATGSLLNPSIGAFSMSGCHPIEDYCGPTGPDMVKFELLEGVFKSGARDITGLVLPPPKQPEVPEKTSESPDPAHANP